MAKEEGKSVQLEGGPKMTSTTVEFLSSGALRVVYYDYSDSAGSSMGGDVEYFLTVQPDLIPRIRSLLGLTEGGPGTECIELLHALRDRFAGYYTIREWFEENDIEFVWENNPWPG